MSAAACIRVNHNLAARLVGVSPIGTYIASRGDVSSVWCVAGLSLCGEFGRAKDLGGQRKKTTRGRYAKMTIYTKRIQNTNFKDEVQSRRRCEQIEVHLASSFGSAIFRGLVRKT